MKTVFSSWDEYALNQKIDNIKALHIPSIEALNERLKNDLIDLAEFLNDYYLNQTSQLASLIPVVQNLEIEQTIFRNLCENKRISLLWNLKTHEQVILENYARLENTISIIENFLSLFSGLNSTPESVEKLSNLLSIIEETQPFLSGIKRQKSLPWWEQGKKTEESCAYVIPSRINSRTDYLKNTDAYDVFFNWLYLPRKEEFRGTTWEDMMENLDNFDIIRKMIDNKYERKYFELVKQLIININSISDIYEKTYDEFFKINEEKTPENNEAKEDEKAQELSEEQDKVEEKNDSGLTPKEKEILSELSSEQPKTIREIAESLGKKENKEVTGSYLRSVQIYSGKLEKKGLVKINKEKRPQEYALTENGLEVQKQLITEGDNS